MPDPTLVGLAEKILETFEQMAPIYAGSRLRVGKRWHIKFYEAAQLSIELGQSPVEFVKNQLEGMARKGAIFPSAIACRTLQALVDPETQGVSSARYYKSQLDLFKDLKMIYTPREILHDQTFQLSPLVRYVLAKEYACVDLVDGLKEAALMELSSDVIAREVFGAQAKELGLAPTVMPERGAEA